MHPALRTSRRDPYAGAKIEIAQQFGVPTLALGIGVVLALLPFYPPTRAEGATVGWAITAFVVMLGFASMAVFRARPDLITFGVLLTLQYAVLVQLALVQWLAGGRAAPYGQLLALVLVGVGFTHPPVRVATFALGTIAVAFSPLIYAPDHFPVGEVITQMAVWVGLTATFAAAMVRIRGVRTGLRDEADTALRKALVDELTQLGNRTGFQEALRAGLTASEAESSPLGLILVDIDDFKQINDTHGHLAGDEALRAVGEALRASVRHPDACFRWGGDEFAVLLANTDAKGAIRVAQRIGDQVAQTCSLPDGSRLNVCCGWSELGEGMGADDLLAEADRVLLARKAGRPSGSLRVAPGPTAP